MSQYDLLVIGSGPGGYVAAIRASQLGMKVGVVERSELGGICLNWGCIPTKALLKSAQVFEYMKHASDYGISVKDVKPDIKAMVKRSREVAGGMNKGIQFLFKKNKIEHIEGTGILKSQPRSNSKPPSNSPENSGKNHPSHIPHIIEVTRKDGKKSEVTAMYIILATGARSKELPNMLIDGKKILGYREAMILEKQPKSMVVVGAGAIGVEFAYFYNAIGTKVTLIEYMDRIVPVEDEDISKELERSFKKSGMTVLTSTSVEKVDTKVNICKISIKAKKETQKIEAEIVLSATGIISNLENLGLNKVGVTTDNGKVLVDDFYQTNIPGIFAIGDIVKGPALAHVASAEGIICVEKIAGKDTEPLDYNNLPGCTYCQPEIASVGYTEKRAKEAGYEIKVGKFPFTASGKASAAGAKEGFIKVIYDAKYGEWLGAHMIGANVTEMIAEAVTARKLETTGHEIIKAVHPHPTMSEAIMEATAAAYGEVIHL